MQARGINQISKSHVDASHPMPDMALHPIVDSHAVPLPQHVIPVNRGLPLG